MWAITLRIRIKNAYKSIRLKFTLAYLLITILAFACLGAALIRLVGVYVFTRAAEEKQELLSFISADLSEAYAGGDTRTLWLESTRAAGAVGGRVVVIDGEGMVISDSASLINGYACPVEQFFSSAEEADAAHALLKAQKAQPLEIEGERYLIVCMQRVGDGAVIAACPASPVYEGLVSTLGMLLALAGAILVVCALLGLLITRSFTRPVKTLRSAISRLSVGDFSVRAEEVGNNELTELIHAFNDMTTKMELLDRSRNQFVSNASHELKTPLASMKILIEALLYQQVYDEKTNKEFLGDVVSEIDRLNQIVQDLLTLVGMDTGETKLNLAPVDLATLAGDNVKRLQPLAHGRGVELDLEIVDELTINGDKLKLEQVLYNLIDNAIKYTPRGGGVQVKVQKRGAYALMSVTDNGIGIPKSEQEHIFDRFYRVDKARSRATGGTGLGLSIARQMILAHGGNITVSSEEDKGSTFNVSLPLPRGGSAA